MSTFNYGHSRSSQHGTMVCTQCHKPIVGEYRYRDGALGWICHHRECSPLDSEWVRRDRNVQLQREAAQRQLNDAIAFRDNYGVGELDELIEQLQEYLK